MLALSGEEIVRAWEAGRAGSDVDRALAPLAIACPDRDPRELADLPLGRRDDLLLSILEQTFTRELRGATACPACEEKLEFTLRAADLRVRPDPGADSTFPVAAGSLTAEVRLPTSADLRIAAGAGTTSAARRALLARCVIRADRQGELVDAGDLSEEEIGRIAEEMVRRDPQSEVVLELQCDTCRAVWSATLEIDAFLWAEIESAARTLLLDVHTLARAYGWSEGEILRLRPSRRRYYVSLVTG
jgi:hypothetical protein